MLYDGGESGEAPIVVETTFGMAEKPLERSRAIPPFGGPTRLKVVNRDFGSSMQVPSGLREERSNVTARAFCGSLEGVLAAGAAATSKLPAGAEGAGIASW